MKIIFNNILITICAILLFSSCDSQHSEAKGKDKMVNKKQKKETMENKTGSLKSQLEAKKVSFAQRADDYKKKIIRKELMMSETVAF